MDNSLFKKWWFILIAVVFAIPLAPYVFALFAIFKTTKSNATSKMKIIGIASMIILTLAIAPTWAETFFPKENSNNNIQTTPNVELPEEINNNQNNGEMFTVERVIDGDTFKLANGETVRLIGIDTPESVKPNTPVECFSKEASEFLKLYIEGKEVRLERDTTNKDVYNRLLRYAYLGDILINELLVKEGYAISKAYEPDIKYQGILETAQTSAQNNNIGLWKECINESTPTPTLDTQDVQGQPIVNNPINQNTTSQTTNAQSNDECLIKGNISTTTDEKIYHVPGQRDYNKTKISEDKGERWFCTEQEAIDAGWRKAMQ